MYLSFDFLFPFTTSNTFGVNNSLPVKTKVLFVKSFVSLPSIINVPPIGFELIFIEILLLGLLYGFSTVGIGFGVSAEKFLFVLQSHLL